MKSILLTTLSVFLLVLISSPTFAADEKAGVIIPIGLMYTTNTQNPNNVSTTNTYFWADPHLGYRFAGGLYVGASYFYNTVETSSTTSTTTTSTWLAPEVGYMSGGWFIRAGYAPSTASVTISSPSSSYDTGSGFYGDAGYEAMLGDHVGIGAYLKYYSMTFTKQTIAGTQTTLANNFTTSQLMPMLMVAFHL